MPEYHKLFAPILTALDDGNEYEFDEIKDLVSEQILIAKPSTFKYRFGRACNDLTKAGFITKSKSKQLTITDAGLKALSNEDKEDPLYWSMCIAYALRDYVGRQLEELDKKYGKLDI